MVALTIFTVCTFAFGCNIMVIDIPRLFEDRKACYEHSEERTERAYDKIDDDTPDSIYPEYRYMCEDFEMLLDTINKYKRKEIRKRSI